MKDYIGIVDGEKGFNQRANLFTLLYFSGSKRRIRVFHVSNTNELFFMRPFQKRRKEGKKEIEEEVQV